MSATIETAPSAAAARALFRQRFGRAPDAVASAPGRVNLIGEHTDYNGGEVLPIGIERRTWVAVGVDASATASRLRAVSSNESNGGEASLADPKRSERWWDYLTGVAAPIVRDSARGGKVGIDAAVVSDVPAGAGLSSSAALEVATAMAVSRVLGEPLELREAAMIGWRAETGFVGVACGIMDQFASALARERFALHLDCATTETDHAPFADAVLIVDSAVRRSLRHSEFNQRQAECAEALRLLRNHWPELTSLAAATPEQIVEAKLPDPLDRRALHVSRETRRVQDAVARLGRGEPLNGELLLGSHASLRDLYECSRPELDWLVERSMKEPGVRGARLTGAGWGGCIIAVGDERALAAAAPAIGRDYERQFSLKPRVWLSKAAAGARIEGE
ncbi:MAG TPA: galactokinase [Gemmatimonadaceae bacterium]|nr:galactokinase [Gemmatimonadaceae bacterium]